MSPLLDNQPATYVKQIRKKLLVYSTSSLSVVFCFFVFATLLNTFYLFNQIIVTCFLNLFFYKKKLLALKETFPFGGETFPGFPPPPR